MELSFTYLEKRNHFGVKENIRQSDLVLFNFETSLDFQVEIPKRYLNIQKKATKRFKIY